LYTGMHTETLGVASSTYGMLAGGVRAPRDGAAVDTKGVNPVVE